MRQTENFGILQVAWGGYVVLLVAIYWTTEAMPLGVTALLPAALFPVTGIIPSKEIAPFYMTV